RRRIAVFRRVLLDEVEDLLLALRQVLPDVHYGPLLLVSWLGSEHLFDTVAGGQDRRKRERAAGLYCGRTRADGGIGRRARLRAWSGITGWRFESSSAHRAKAPHRRGFCRSRGQSPVRGELCVTTPLTTVAPIPVALP